MDIFEAIKTRRSIRTYSRKVIPKEVLERIIEAGVWAPTACNRQGFRFIAIDNEELKKKIVENGAASFIKDAPIALIVLYDNRTDNLEYQDHIQSAAAAIQNILLAAHAQGIGTCWICHMPRKEVLRKHLDIPDFFDPIACITMGYHEHNPKPLPRIGVKDVLCFNSFSFRAEDSRQLRTAAKRKFRRLYFSMPPKIRRRIRPLASRFEKRFEGT